MWTLWPTAPWCSGSSSAAVPISGKCAARHARDTDLSTMAPTASIVGIRCTLAGCLKTSRWALKTAALALLEKCEIEMGGCRTYTRSCNCWQGPLFFFSHNPAQTRHLSGASWAIHSTGESAADTWSDRDSHHCLSLFLFKQSLCCNILVLLYFTLATGLVAVLS